MTVVTQLSVNTGRQELATIVANRVEIIHPSHTTVRTVRYTAVQFFGQIIIS